MVGENLPGFYGFPGRCALNMVRYLWAGTRHSTGGHRTSRPSLTGKETESVPVHMEDCGERVGKFLKTRPYVSESEKATAVGWGK